MKPNMERTEKLIAAIHKTCAGSPAIDAIAAAASFLGDALAYASPDLADALDNVDRLGSELKDELRRRLAN